MKKPNEAAVYHEAIGALEAVLKKVGDVPAEDHDLGNVLVTLQFPPHARVTRSKGTNGDGTDALPPIAPTALTLTMPAVLLFLERMNLSQKTMQTKEDLWQSCIVDAMKGMTTDIPPEAGYALERVTKAMPPKPPGEPRKRATPAKRTGEKEVAISIKRLTKKEAALQSA